MTSHTYRVEGMTCAHCVASVSAEVSAVDGVGRAEADLATQTVTVEMDAPVEDAAVAAAVAEAGYAFAGRA